MIKPSNQFYNKKRKFRKKPADSRAFDLQIAD